MPETDLLRQVSVRLMVAEERERFDKLLEEEHYLKSARLGDKRCVTWLNWLGNG